MMKKLAVFLFLVVSLGTLHAQDLQRVRSYIDTLAAPGMHGRGYVKQGDKIAAEYLENQFRDIGLHPFPSNQQHPFFQYFSFDINTFPDVVFLKIGKDTLVTGKDYILHPSSGSGKKKLKMLKLDTSLFTDVNAQKKFLKQKTENLCLVLKSYPNFKKKWEEDLPPAVVKKIFAAGCLIKLQPKKLTASLSPVQLKQPYLEVLEDAFPEKAQQMEVHVNAELKKSYRSQNVMGYIPGKELPDSFIVVSAHYDHLGRMGCNTYFPGANDNASGISMMLELARHYKINPPSVSVVFIAFGAEEAGLIGSKYYVGQPLFPLSKIRFLINLDLEGTGDEGITVVNATKFTQAFELLKKINEEKKYLPAIKPRGPAANSDHYFFTMKEVPSFFIYTMGGITAYHDIYDRAETLPLTKFTEVFQLLTDFIHKYQQK